MRLILLIHLSFILSHCQSVNNTSDFDNVFGNDDRRPWSQLDQTLKDRVGILYRDNYACTATLVSRNVILTNAHCVYESNGRKKSGIFCFYINYQDLSKDPLDEEASNDNENFDIDEEGFFGNFGKKKSCKKKSSKYTFDAVSKAAFLKSGTKYPSDKRSSDWALLKLEVPLGEKNGFIPIVALEEEQYNDLSVTLPGFSGDYKRKYGSGSFHKNCKVEYLRKDLIRHSCDTTGGASGSPLIIQKDDDYAIIGLHAASENSDCKGKERVDGKCKPGTPYRDAIANKAVLSKEFIDQIP